MSRHLEPREWKSRGQQSHADELVAALQADTGLSRVTVGVCLTRGLTTAQAIKEFLAPRFETLTPALKIRDLDRAVDRLGRARAAGERVRVFGDYDVDGTTGAALLGWILRDCGFTYDLRQPDRFKDGYGLNVRAVEEAMEAGTGLLLTVDCGITSFDAADRARELGLDLVVVDHHQLDPKRGIPPAVAVVDPQRPDCESGLRQLCGCGLAFYLAMALRARGRQEGWFAAGAEPNLKQHLDLVVMATAADMVPLTGDNHVLVRHGLEVLKRSKKPGVRALLEVAGIGSRDVSPGHLGFVIGPRINASGRMQSASLALELLTCEDPARAMELALALEKLNHERAELQNQIWDEVRARVEEGIKVGRFRHGVVVADPGWHEGVVGIVASRVTETFRRPAAVIALREDHGKGSVRSYGGKDVLSALRAASTCLLGFGGHKHAAGLSIANGRVEEFENAFDQALATLVEDADSLPLLIEGSCSIGDLQPRTLEELENLGPFGPGNPEPVFVIRATVRDHRVLKERHLKLTLSPVGSTGSIEAIWFHGVEHQAMASGELLRCEAEWAGVPELNRFRGAVTPTFRVRDWHPIGPV
ncbi:MAG: single-stranded-DNA-specific exonuclease RecJ [Oligoflexia bacterium]|nr:single-stranded-DNA-specific exonuclease RecJ [Oligoflexia bacterium]